MGKRRLARCADAYGVLRVPMPAVLVVLSCVVLTLEVLETKIFAYSLENNLMFVVVGIVLLGFGAGGTALCMRKQLGDVRSLVDAIAIAVAERNKRPT